MLKRSAILGLFLISFGQGQSKYPADSLLHSPHVSLWKKGAILPIAGWQRLSYNTNALNCQFYPSCSNYSAQAIQHFGWIKGSIMASDRIIRCNPFAFHYHIQGHLPFQTDGRLVDHITQDNRQGPISKSPWVAAGFSAIIPGTGRMYAGRIFDGLMGLWTFYLFGKSAYVSIKNDRPKSGALFLVSTAIIYAGEIYGAWRTAHQIQE